jgi:hypothetical protein
MYNSRENPTALQQSIHSAGRQQESFSIAEKKGRSPAQSKSNPSQTVSSLPGHAGY